MAAGYLLVAATFMLWRLAGIPSRPPVSPSAEATSG
jgi:hypothetical protein